MFDCGPGLRLLMAGTGGGPGRRRRPTVAVTVAPAGPARSYGDREPRRRAETSAYRAGDLDGGWPWR